MSKRVSQGLVATAGRLLLAFVFVFPQMTWAGQGQQTSSEADSQQIVERQAPVATAAKPQNEEAQSETSEKTVAREKPSGGLNQGIKVHGHWTIEVRNPDGTVVTHREFENSIQTTGSAALASLLGGNQLLGPWEVNLSGSPQPCIVQTAAGSGLTGGPEPCVIVPTNAAIDDVPILPLEQNQAISATLTVTVSSGQLVLNGSVTAQTSTSVSSVATVLNPCVQGGTVTLTGGISTFPCNALRYPFPISAAFTSATLTQPVPVSVGQTIAVTVTISFS